MLKSIEHAQTHRKVIVYIEQGLDQQLVADNPVAAKESSRARALVAAHLDHVKDPNVYVVKSMQEMLALSIQLYPAVVAMRRACDAQHAAQRMLDDVRSAHTAGPLSEGPG